MKKKSFHGWLKNLPPDFYPLFLIALSLALHLGWMYYTNYTEEDAFITFRIAQRVAGGHGFAYNTEPLYASTTPLLTLLLAAWIRFVSPNVIPGARILDIFTAMSTFWFTWRALKLLDLSIAGQMGALFVLITSSSLIYMNTQGMETPLGLCLLAASWYFGLKGRFSLVGVMCGLLLWVRIDFAFWVLILLAFTALSSMKGALRAALIASAVYLPWVVFAFFYFGSPIPYTVTAKWVAYNQFNDSSYGENLSVVFEYLSAIHVQGQLALWGAAISISLAIHALWTNRLSAPKGLLLLAAFIILEIARLTLTRTTYFNRYFVPILWATMILFGIGLGTLWERIKTSWLFKQAFMIFLFVLFVLQIQTSLDFAHRVKDRQFYRHEQSLRAMGLWLKENTDPNSVVLLEPLGYVGYYSERRMLDEVGLVTPAITELKRQQIEADAYAAIFKPDYIIAHCDDPSRIPNSTESGLGYKLVKTFNPLGFYNGSYDPNNLAWLSCYQVWENATRASQ